MPPIIFRTQLIAGVNISDLFVIQKEKLTDFELL